MNSKLISLSPNLLVGSVNRAVDFYVTNFQFKLVVSVPESGTLNWAMVERDGVTLMFQTLESMKEDMPSLNIESKGGLGTFFVKMVGIDELYREAKSKKLTIPVDMRTTFYGMKEFTIQDPDGYFVTFAEEV